MVDPDRWRPTIQYTKFLSSTTLSGEQEIIGPLNKLANNKNYPPQIHKRPWKYLQEYAFSCNKWMGTSFSQELFILYSFTLMRERV